MTPLFNNLNDIEDDRDTDRKRRPAYASRRDFLLISIALAAIFGILYFVVIRPGIAQADWVVSQDNIRSIREALFLYAADNSDGLPAVYLPLEADRQGRPITWANQLLHYTRVDVFRSRASRSEWNTLLGYTHPKRGWIEVPLSYGMLAGADTRRTYELTDDVRILGETIGGGHAGGYNPLPLGNRDGFMIGYDNSNRAPNAETQSVTRMAFPVRDGEAETLHRQGTITIRADGRLAVLESAAEIRVEKRGNLPFGPWVVN